MAVAPVVEGMVALPAACHLPARPRSRPRPRLRHLAVVAGAVAGGVVARPGTSIDIDRCRIDTYDILNKKLVIITRTATGITGDIATL